MLLLLHVVNASSSLLQASMSSTGSTGAELDILGTSPGKGSRLAPLHVERSQYAGYFQKAPGAEFHSRSPDAEDPTQVCGCYVPAYLKYDVTLLFLLQAGPYAKAVRGN